MCMDPKEQSRGGSWTPNISAWPNDAVVCSLSQVLETGSILPRYFLSEKACAGILRRAGARGRTLPKRVHDKADAGSRDAMDLAYLTGQRVTDTRLMDERDVRDGQIWVFLGKTKAKRRIEVTGELKVLIDRIMSRKSGHKVRSTRLIVAEDGTPMTVAMLRRKFDIAREAAGVAKPEFQMRDLRAKAGTGKAESSGDIMQAKDQLGHTTVVMTEQYIRNRKGKKVSPTK